MKQLVVIPAYNEARVVGRVIQSVRKVVPQADILVIDDGSEDETFSVAQHAEAVVVRHPLNRGLGGAISTGFVYAKKHAYDAMVTFDADGQHEAQDLKVVFNTLQANQTDVVIGNRMHDKNHIPWDRKWLNTCANIMTFLLFGHFTHDSQSGFRGFNRKAIELMHIKTNQMEVSSEIFGEIARLKLKYKEIPIQVRYTAYSRQKGQQNSNALPVFFKLVLRLAR